MLTVPAWLHARNRSGPRSARRPAAGAICFTPCGEVHARIASQLQRSSGRAARFTTGPRESKQEHEPDSGSKSHRAHTVERHERTSTVEIDDTAQYEEIEADNEHRGIPSTARAAPREYTGGDVADTHERIEDQQGPIDDVPGIASGEDTCPRGDRHQAEQNRDNGGDSLS